MEYPLCNQTVTVYRIREDQVLRQVIADCYLEASEEMAAADNRPNRKFLLVVPGKVQRVFPGDRVVPGIGPKDIKAGSLLPVACPDLLLVSKVKRFFWNGELSHIEAM